MDQPRLDTSNSPFQKLTKQWLSKMKAARDQKKEFQRDGEEAMRFFRGPYDFMYGLKEGVPQSGDFVFVGEAASSPRPSVAMTLNKVAEAVQIFGPHLYHRNPTRKINPRELPMVPIDVIGNPQDPNVQQQYAVTLQAVKAQRDHDKTRAHLLQWYQDYTPTACDLKTECRNAIDEALIKGMGVLWTELWQPAASDMRITSSFYDSVDHLLVDCDMEQRRKAKWCAKICTLPVWEFEQKYGIPHGTLKGSSESYGQKQFVESEGGMGEMARREGKTNNLVTYYEVYSKMGMGTLMSKAGFDGDNSDKDIDRYGQYCYLVMCRELNYPANVPPEIWEDDEAVQKAVQWPIPFWADDAWPYAEIVFHEVPNQVWPMSHFKPAMGELKFLNWAYSFLASRMKKSARDIIVCQKSMGEEMRRVLLSGEDMEMVEMDKSHGTIKEIVEILQFPNVNGDMFKVIELVTKLFEQRTGLSELMYGETSHAYRSAEEANVKQGQLNIRPDDMVNKTEDWMTQVARMEALAARWSLDPQRDIRPLMGDIGAQWWAQYIVPADPTEILHQLEYRIEANSARKPNREKDIADANAAMQNLFAPLMEVAKADNVSPVNALITKWAESQQWDPSAFLLPEPNPPPPPPPDQPKISVSIDFATLDPGTKEAIWNMAGVQVPPQEPAPDQTQQLAQQQALEIQAKQQEMAHKEATHKQDLAHAKEKHASDLKLAKEKAAKPPEKK